MIVQSPKHIHDSTSSSTYPQYSADADADADVYFTINEDADANADVHFIEIADADADADVKKYADVPRMRMRISDTSLMHINLRLPPPQHHQH